MFFGHLTYYNFIIACQLNYTSARVCSFCYRIALDWRLKLAGNRGMINMARGKDLQKTE